MENEVQQNEEVKPTEGQTPSDTQVNPEETVAQPESNEGSEPVKAEETPAEPQSEEAPAA